MPTPQKVVDLVATFDRNADEYLTGHFNEADLRQQFVNPLFKCLGWDMDNEAGYAEAYKDVIHEAALKIGGATKAPDYSFRIGGTPKFYLEAKKPSVDIKGDGPSAYQLRRYGWTGKMPLSILTNFAGFAVYDCRIRPAQTDKASTARILYLPYSDFAEGWDDKIAGVFSRDAVLKGSFDKYAESKKGKRGTATVDAAFLEEIETWREELAKNLALRNPNLSSRELNFAVQITIDRIIFLRMCEDRGIEPYGQLQSLQIGTEVYGRLREVYHKADDRYNSGLFHFKKEKDRPDAADVLTPELHIDDKVLKGIFKGLYYPESPYEFSVLPVEVLGQVYEQFLGKVIRLTAGHQAKVEEKPEVKKAGGVYYTPAYIVDYIVQHTVGRLLEGKSPKQAEKLKILDPACGSGSFLLGAYRYLLEWHQKKYEEDGPVKHKKELFQSTGGLWRLTSGERKRILLNNIYGVDIDAQAVEVTKLSLLLKVLEGESQETLARQLRMFHERALPDLGSNIKCGNSLVGPDFYEGQQTSMFDEDEMYRVNVFDWKTAFPEIVKAGGFDAVVGNPPWGQKAINEAEAIKQYLWKSYPSSSGIFDLFRPFVERGIHLLQKGGAFGMVLPDIVLLKDYPQTRLFLIEELTLERIDWWGMAFANAVIDAATIIGTRRSRPPGHRVAVSVRDKEEPFCQSIPQTDFLKNPRHAFNLFLTAESRKVIEQLQKGPLLGDFFEIHEGVHSGNIRDELFVHSRIDESCREIYFGRGEIAPHLMRWDGRFIRLNAVPCTKTRERYANLGKPEWYDREKLLVRRTGDYVLAAADKSHRYASNNFFLVFPRKDFWLDINGLCALLNSQFMTWYFRTIEPRRGRVFAELKIKHLTTFPVPSQNEELQDLNRLGSERAALAGKLARATSPHESTVVQRAADYLDSQIEGVIRDLFCLPKELANVFSNQRSTNGIASADSAAADLEVPNSRKA